MDGSSQTRMIEWAEQSGCALLVLFGSAARGASHTRSDIDLAVSFDRLPDPHDRLRMLGELQDICAPTRVDLVFLHRDTSPVLRFEIFQHGQPLYESSPGLFTEEAVRAVVLYEDALPFRRLLRQQIRELIQP
jgi:predicted nucleotidyltransferase